MTTDNEARDYHGRWTDGGAEAPSPLPFQLNRTGGVMPTKFTGGAYVSVHTNDAGAEKARQIALAAVDTAKQHGFNPENIAVQDTDYKFNLNGKELNAAGTAHEGLKSASGGYMGGFITLYANHLALADVPQVMTHEVMHEKFHAFLSDYEAEREQVLKLPHGDVKTDPMKPDGTLREPWAAQFPTYQAYTTLVEGTNSRPDLRETMAREDGCTPYSKDWWKAVETGTARDTQAIHETLSEMASLRSRKNDMGPQYEHLITESGPPTLKEPLHAENMTHDTRNALRFFSPEPSKDWTALYNAVNSHWQKNYANKVYTVGTKNYADKIRS